MPGTPDNTVILHWDECRTAWANCPGASGFDFEGSPKAALACWLAPMPHQFLPVGSPECARQEISASCVDPVGRSAYNSRVRNGIACCAPADCGPSSRQR